MNKSELISKVAKSAHLSEEDTARALDVVFTTVKNTLKRGEDVKLFGFGTFYVGKRAARRGVNPRTGDVMKIRACKLPKFRPSVVLKNALK